jgi:RNA polymerase sigma-70 factor (ECF subfamily)
LRPRRVRETLIKANESYDARSVQNVEGWLFRIAHNACMDVLRRRKREQAVFADADVEALADTGAEADRRHVATAALRTFMRLPPAQRSTVILADVLGYALDEAASVMGTTVPAVKAALHRGRTYLREISQRPDDAAPSPDLSAADQTLLAAYAERFRPGPAGHAALRSPGRWCGWTWSRAASRCRGAGASTSPTMPRRKGCT